MSNTTPTIRATYFFTSEQIRYGTTQELRQIVGPDTVIVWGPEPSGMKDQPWRAKLDCVPPELDEKLSM